MRGRILKGTAKAGYTARAIVYFIVGGFAVLAALGRGGDTTDSRGALLKLFATGYGTTLITLVAAGLLCFALWRLFQGVMNTDNHGLDIKGLLVRAGCWSVSLPTPPWDSGHFRRFGGRAPTRRAAPPPG